MKRARVSSPARLDLREIASYLHERDPRAAQAASERLRRAVADVAANPGLGHRRDDLLGADDRRVFSVPPWLVIYRRRRGTVEVIRVLHAARDVAASLRGEDSSEE